ncbi:cell division protein FtsB [Derxia lacustris]|uniref:cell division protein FtsB n=1 Tax=Derxia lacustris TaxID=764842 RepID=UPI000A1742E3|nr:cell division protein FtsB [Derxia lacustris]
MRWIAVVVFIPLALIQYPLWFGPGGWKQVREREDQVLLAQARIAGLRMRNARLAAEVRDLRDGTAAVEERARLQLGMIRNDEVFVQILDANAPAPVNQPLEQAKPVKPAARPAAIAAPAARH